MKISILIVSKNRKGELFFTLNKIKNLVDSSVHEVLVLLDGSNDDSDELINQFNWINWTVLKESIGASAARNLLYPKAQGEILIGLDDDAHPLNTDFIEHTTYLFKKHANAGIIAFQEVKGIYSSDSEALAQSKSIENEYLTNEFIGCGFAIRKKAYDATNGFPIWIDIYGEEPCVAIEVMANGLDILYSDKIKVNHRVNKEVRKNTGQNYFRFGKQLKNSTYYFLVYYPFPFGSIVKLYWHNFRKYALTDVKCFRIYFLTMLEVILHLPRVFKYRNPVEIALINKIRNLKSLKF
jgi:GT2 family glycosyltransferase